MKHGDDYLKICDDLKKLIEKTGEPLEGNCMYHHLSFDQWDVLLNKRINYQRAAEEKKFICEIGFNAGHSVLAMLLANPHAQYVLFDLGAHAYTRPCFEYLKRLFPHTLIDIFWGDSRKTLAEYHKNNPAIVFDLIHIDGGHTSEVYSVDWKNSLEATSSGSLLIFDDTDNKKISAFIDTEIKKGVVSEVEGFLKTAGYEHRILEKK
jgi:predicted O-methyltransferase YrrM